MRKCMYAEGRVRLGPPGCWWIGQWKKCGKPGRRCQPAKGMAPQLVPRMAQRQDQGRGRLAAQNGMRQLPLRMMCLGLRHLVHLFGFPDWQVAQRAHSAHLMQAVAPTAALKP